MNEELVVTFNCNPWIYTIQNFIWEEWNKWMQGPIDYQQSQKCVPE